MPDASLWLLALAIQEQGFHLNIQEFWDVLHLHYNSKVNYGTPPSSGYLIMVPKYPFTYCIKYNDLKNQHTLIIRTLYVGPKVS